MPRHALPPIPLVEARNIGPKQKPTAIHLTISQTTSDKGAALGVASYLHSFNAPARSHHFVVDEAITYRCVPTSHAAASFPYRSLSVHICAQPHEEWPMWEDATATRVMHRAADLVADLCLTHKIKPRYLDEGGLARWTKHRWRMNGGIMVRVLGTWPYEAFLGDVKSQMVIKTM